MKVFITGKPGSGKTTLIKEVLKHISQIPCCGFYTEEIREKGERKGFKVKTIFSKEEALLAHINFEKKFSVGKYGVDVEGFERVIAKEFKDKNPETLYIIDEVGPMECYSKRFIGIVEELLRGNFRILGTVKLKGGGLMEKIRNDKSIRLFHLTEKNRKETFSEVLNLLKREYEGNF
jgi:nucleoside-triphosphatase